MANTTPTYIATGTAFERILSGVTLFAPNTTIFRDLDVNSVVEEYNIKLTGRLTLAGYTTPPTIRVDGLENLISNVSLRGSALGSGVTTTDLFNVDAAFLRFKTAIVNGVWPDRTDVGNQNGDYDFETNFTIFFGAKRSVVGSLAYLDLRRYQSARLNFQTRDVSALVHGGVAGVPTLSNVQITMSSKERVGATPQAVNPYVRTIQRIVPLNNFGPNQDFIGFPQGNRIMRTYVRTLAGDVSYAEPTDALVSTTLFPEGAHVKVITQGPSGTEVRLDDEYTHIQTKNRNRFKLETMPVGWLVIEYSPTGIVSDMLDMRKFGTTGKLQLDTTAVAGAAFNTLNVYDEEIVANG